MTKKEALRLRAIVEIAAQSLDDKTALEAVTLHPMWKPDMNYETGFKVRKDGKLWRVLQAHTSQTGWEPENATSLFEQINETHEGTMENPIPYEGNMALESGKYYSQDGVIYLCDRDTVNPVYNALSELVGLYVSVA